jgi:hypothetical protein
MSHEIDVYKIFERKSPDEVQKILDNYLMPDGGNDTVRYGGSEKPASKTSMVDAAFANVG